MTPQMKAEMIRLQLLKEYQEQSWEEDFVMEIVIIAKELGEKIDNILDWTIMKYRTVANAIAEFYKRAREEAELEMKTSLRATTLR